MGPNYPPVAFHFRVEFNAPGIVGADARFQEVSGLNTELEVVTIEEGGENRFAHRLPGRAKYSNLVLKRGLVAESRLLTWFQTGVNSLRIMPAAVTVSLL